MTAKGTKGLSCRPNDPLQLITLKTSVLTMKGAFITRSHFQWDCCSHDSRHRPGQFHFPDIWRHGKSRSGDVTSRPIEQMAFIIAGRII